MTARGRRLAAMRKVRELALVGKALAFTGHPVMAQIVPMRFCNLSCAYCNEYDKVSKPVPIEEMERRIDHLGRLGTSIITISGGEPLTHPELDDVIRRMRKVGAMAGMITNGYLLNVERIERLNKAGLDHMQISIDNIEPDDVSMKSLKVLDKKLQMLAEHAEFHVNINSVVGGGIKNPNDALVISKRALELGFSNTIGIIHDGSGQLKPLQPEERRFILKCATWSGGAIRASTSFRKRLRRASRMTGAAGLVRGTCTSAKTGWCITARSSAGIRGSRLPNTPPRT
jgi:molybdenum cofactor biosynthesis enzyme MoaA